MPPSIRISSTQDLEKIQPRDQPVVILFSGGLDSTFLAAWLKRELGFTRLYPLCIALGIQTHPVDFGRIESALDLSIRQYDLTDEFISEYVAKLLFATEKYAGFHPLSASLSRPLLAKAGVELASEIGSVLILHCSSKTQNTFRRFQGALSDLNFLGSYGSVFYETVFTREDKLEYLAQIGLPFPKERAFSVDENIWCREIESGSLDDVENPVCPDHLFQWLQTPTEQSEPLSITFSKGLPSAINGDSVSFREAIERLNQKAGSFGIGRVFSLEENQDGTKFPEFRETPAAILLMDAFKQLEQAVHPYETLLQKNHLAQIWIREAVEGRWFGTLKNGIDAFLDVMRQKVSGTVSYTLLPNQFRFESLTAEEPLYGKSREALLEYARPNSISAQ